MTNHQGNKRRGSALIAVLWLSAALSAIAFAMSVTVRGETDRAATASDDLRAYYLASSGVDRAIAEMLWSLTGNRRTIPPDAPFVDYDFPSGTVHVEIIPDTVKLNINKAPYEDLYKLMITLGIEPGRAGTIAAAIIDWRSPGGITRFDSFYLSSTPSFQSPHASFQEIEELLSVQGVTPEIFYGAWTPAGNGDPSKSALVRHPGLNDVFTVYGQEGGSFDVASRLALGLQGEGPNPPILGSNVVITFRGTAKLRLSNGQFSDMRRTVGAQVKYLPPGSAELPFHVLRWFDTAWSYN